MTAKPLPTSRTVQLEAQNAELLAEVANRRALEGRRGAYLLGELADGIVHLLDLAEAGDRNAAATLQQFRQLLERIPEPGQSGSRVLRPEPGQRFS